MTVHLHTQGGSGCAAAGVEPVKQEPPSFERREGRPSCGSKYENLVRLQSALQLETGKVPFFVGFTDSQILPLLSDSTLALWKALGEECKDYTGPYTPPLCSEIQASVQRDICGGKLDLSPDQEKALAACQGKKLIVRSSSNEDTEDMVNAGRNVSEPGIDPTVEGLKKGIAVVVASYFSWPSLKNRMAFEDPFKQLPLCSVVVMEQIVDLSEEEPVVSGVMMTHKPSWVGQQEGTIPHIVASWGFGGGIVSGKVACDEWVLTDQICYATVRRKPHRLAADSVVPKINPAPFKERAALSGQQIDQLRRAGSEIEAFFKRPMDVEFVFQREQLYIVQARPIQASEIKSPTFIDPNAIPTHIPRFCAKTILPGSSEVVSLTDDQILFAEDLEHADLSYVPSSHRAVILSKEPQTGNTHAEVNLASHSALCFALSLEEWERCKDAVEYARYDTYATGVTMPIKMCPQTGLLVITAIELPIRRGLFIHPARFPMSLASEGKGLQGHSSHLKIARLKRLITATGEQIHAQMGEVGESLQEFFAEVFSRPTCVGSVRETGEKLQVYANQIFGAMQRVAASHKPTLLSFHANALRQLLEQTAPQVIGAHSLAGLEEATNLSPLIEAFLNEFSTQKVLCDLAMLGRKAFDEATQAKWLSFLRERNPTTTPTTWHTLLEQVSKFDSIDQATLWFTFHFAVEEMPETQVLIDQNRALEPFLTVCIDFIERLHLLKERTTRAVTDLESDEVWQALEAASLDLFSFSTRHPTKNLFQKLQTSHLTYELIQLWDLNIKTLEISKKEIRSRVVQFAGLGQKLISSGLIHGSEWYKQELSKVLKEAANGFSDRSSRKPFSLQHWLVPRGAVYVPIYTDNERLTVIHQNLLKAVGPSFDEVAPLLPSALRSAATIFRESHPDITKRFGKEQGIFATMTDRTASVIINVPLNYHSFVLTIRQNRGSENLEFVGEWRGSDNAQRCHLPFFEALADLTDRFAIQSSLALGADLKVTFMVQGKPGIELLSRAIFRINAGTVYGRDYLRDLILLCHPKELVSETRKEEWEELRETREQILDKIWKKFEETGEVRGQYWDFLEGQADRAYLEKRGLLPQVMERMVAELEGRVSGKKYLRLFSDSVLPSLSIERRKELFWSNLLGPQHDLYTTAFPKELKGEMLARLQREFPAKFEEYCSKDMFARELLTVQQTAPASAAAGVAV